MSQRSSGHAIAVNLKECRTQRFGVQTKCTILMNVTKCGHWTQINRQEMGYQSTRRKLSRGGRWRKKESRMTKAIWCILNHSYHSSVRSTMSKSMRTSVYIGEQCNFVFKPKELAIVPCQFIFAVIILFFWIVKKSFFRCSYAWQIQFKKHEMADRY